MCACLSSQSSKLHLIYRRCIQFPSAFEDLTDDRSYAVFFNEIDDDLANIFISSLSSVDTWLATIQKKQAAARKKPKSILLKPVICMTHCRLYRCCSMLYFWSKDTFKMSKPQRKEANSVLFTLLSGRWYLILNVPSCQFDNNLLMGKLCVFYNKAILEYFKHC